MVRSSTYIGDPNMIYCLLLWRAQIAPPWRRSYTHTLHDSNNTSQLSTISTPLIEYWRKLCRETCRDLDNFNWLASLLVGHLTPERWDSGGTELERLTESGRHWGQVYTINIDQEHTSISTKRCCYIMVDPTTRTIKWSITLLCIPKQSKWQNGVVFIKFPTFHVAVVWKGCFLGQLFGNVPKCASTVLEGSFAKSTVM